MRQPSEAKVLSYFNKLKAVRKECSNYDTLTDIAKNLKIDYVLVMKLEENGIINYDTAVKKYVWQERIPVSTTLASTMYTKCREYYNMKSRGIGARRNRKISWWKRLLKICGW